MAKGIKNAKARRRTNETALAFGKLLAELRQKRGLSQDKFAADAGFHKNSIGMFERGEISPRLDAIFDLAAALNMQGSTLLALLEKKKKSKPLLS